MAIRADVRSVADLKAMAQAAAGAFGKIDILFANAGVAYGTPNAMTDEEGFDRLTDINVKGVFFTVQAVLPVMADGGSIVLNMSRLGQMGTLGRAAAPGMRRPTSTGMSASAWKLSRLARGRDVFDPQSNSTSHSPGFLRRLP